mmetsp:Transcript_21277/g.30773  ORF Transcript_21277/g.30773 Transcript_21277/m.30773 type:complete len:665 (-) Transcript_21277:99-2093(-)
MQVISPEMTESVSSSDINILEVAAKLRAHVDIRDRVYHFKTYEQCFIGEDAVRYMIADGIAGTKAEAVLIGNLLVDFGYIFHVTRDHNFKNEFLFYRFQDDERSHGKAPKDMDGKSVSLWKNFATQFLGEDLGATTRMSMIPELPSTEAGIEPSDLTLTKDIPLIDRHNVKLLDNVHPSGWLPPEDAPVYNLLVIGGGAAGLVSSIGSKGLGAKVALVESHFMGGDCTNFGCVPSKSLIKSASVAKTVRGASEFGVDITGTVTVNFPKVMERMREIRADISDFDAAERLSKLGIDIYIGHGVFDSPTSLVVNNRRIQFRKCIICSGASASVPSIPGLQDVQYLTNESLFNLTDLPPSLTVLGAGPISMEMAQAFARFGSKVTVINRSGVIMRKEDRDAALLVQEEMERDGVTFIHNANIQSVGYDSSELIEVRLTRNNKNEVVVGHELLVATGRKPRIQGMGLEAAGVKYCARDGIIVNDNMRTTNSNIFAAGDCCSQYKFTHMADWMARICIKNTLFFGSDRFSALIIPWCTYTEPEVAHVGLYSSDLEARKIPFDTFIKEFSDNDRAKCEGETAGFVKIHVKKGTDVIVGATIVGQGAGDMISEITTAMHAGMGLASLSSVIHPYPTRADAIRNIGDQYNRSKLTVSVRKMLRAIISLSSKF